MVPVSEKPHYQYNRTKGLRFQIQPGNLRKSIRRKRLKSRDEQTGAQVGISWTGRAFYGRFREFGTSKEPAKPFLRPAFEAKRMMRSGSSGAGWQPESKTAADRCRPYRTPVMNTSRVTAVVLDSCAAW